MVSASSARRRFPRLACRSCHTRPTVSSALKRSSAGRKARDESPVRDANPSATTPGLPPNRYLVYLGLAIVGFTTDLVTKGVVFRWRGLPRPRNEWWLIDRHFGIETSVNPGALFGMGAGFWWLFSLLS